MCAVMETLVEDDVTLPTLVDFFSLIHPSLKLLSWLNEYIHYQHIVGLTGIFLFMTLNFQELPNIDSFLDNFTRGEPYRCIYF